MKVKELSKKAQKHLEKANLRKVDWRPITMDIKKPWTKEETEILLTNYSTMGRKVHELFPYRSKQSVTRKIENLGLKQDEWTFPEYEEHDAGMIRNDYQTNKPLALVLLGDIHVSPFTNEPKFFGWVKWLAEHDVAQYKGKDYEIKVIGMGDYMENGLPASIGLSIWRQKYTPQKQKEIITENFDKFKDKIFGLHEGNHEWRSFKSAGLEPVSDICKDLGVKKYGYGTFTYLTVGKYKYSIYTWHGRSGAQFEHTKLNACIKTGLAVDADIIGMGHVHHRASANRTMMTPKGMRSKYFVLSGHFLRWLNTYAQQMGLTLGKDGASMIYFDNERWDVDVIA